MNRFYIIIVLIYGLTGPGIKGQEFTGPLRGRINCYTYPPQDKTKTKSSSSEKTQNTNGLPGGGIKSHALPFFDDFYYAPLSSIPNTYNWLDASVYVNVGMAIAPPSIGVATFDGLDKNGYPYNISATNNVSAPSDTLTSFPINLFTKGTHTYTPSDSVAFSFLYQATGFGEVPEVDDSLVVEFFKPIAGIWQMGWATRGISTATLVSEDTTFKKAIVMLSDTAFFHDGFKFRFRNKSTTCGSLDHWNVDYVYVDVNRSLLSDSISNVYNDAAIAYVPRPFLKNYSAMPFKQYIANPGGEMGTHFSNFIRNNQNNPTPKNILYNYRIFDNNNNLLYSDPGGAGNVWYFKTNGFGTVTAQSNPSISYTFIPTDTTFFKIVHSINTTPDAWGYNDTVVQIQILNNYYAYDDGTAERAYYLNQPGAEMALRFTLNTPDTLQAMDIFFDPFSQENLIMGSSFRMFVWNSYGGAPYNVLMSDSSMSPRYLQFGYNKIPRYALTTPLPLGPGTYFFGIKQLLDQPLNIGFDRNIDHHEALYYNITGSWNQSSINGSLMIHPIFGRSAYSVGIKENKKIISESNIKVYPNPAGDLLNISTSRENLNHDFSIEIYNTLGEKLIQSDLPEQLVQINTSELTAGIYMVALKQKGLIISQQKLIISR